ncbi:hypothetical protein [Ekhidna sp.]|uniref:hypothetical protein n=1 Tax=Ekhidna sp. TaxID=2608089 RepID=UPI0035110E44
MDKETARYIVIHFANLLTENEATARRHLNSIEKLGEANEDDTKWRLYKEKNWISEDPEVLKLVKNGYDEFELNAAGRIMLEAGNKIYLNKCPNCGKLARTPQARQCRHCGANWHNITTAKFQLNSSFQLTDRPFFLTGQITEGQVNKGDFIDLTMIGLNCKPRITAIEYVSLKTEDNTRKEDIALGTDELDEQEKEYLKSYGSHGTPFDIISRK